MDVYWILIAVLSLVFMVLKRRMRRQQRILSRSASQFDRFAAENLRHQRRSDREFDQQLGTQDGSAEGGP